MQLRFAWWSAMEGEPWDTQVRKMRHLEATDVDNIHLREGGSICPIKHSGSRKFRVYSGE